MAEFNFKETFDKIGKIFVQGLSKRMKQQTGIDGAAYSPPEPSTLRARRSLKGKTSGSTKRLVVTYELSNEAFAHVPYAKGVKIFARNVSHLSGVSYERLIEYNSKGQSRVNTDIKNPPLVFPTNGTEVQMMTQEMEIAKRLFATEAKKQVKELAKVSLKVKLNIG